MHDAILGIQRIIVETGAMSVASAIIGDSGSDRSPLAPCLQKNRTTMLYVIFFNSKFVPKRMAF
jgi:hypothetical protein